jgi:hypothetical protein
MHLIPTHEHIELEFKEFHVIKARLGKLNPSLRVIKALNSATRGDETEEPAKEKSVRTMKVSAMFSWEKTFIEIEFWKELKMEK